MITPSKNLYYCFGDRKEGGDALQLVPDWKPFTLRFDVVNLFDHIYELRDGTAIGVFAPQYGPRRGFFLGYSQKF